MFSTNVLNNGSNKNGTNKCDGRHKFALNPPHTLQCSECTDFCKDELHASF